MPCVLIIQTEAKLNNSGFLVMVTAASYHDKTWKKTYWLRQNYDLGKDQNKITFYR